MIATSYPTNLARHYEGQHSSSSQQNQEALSSLEAFNSLVLAHQDAVFRQALWILGDEDAAEDATQETFIKAYRNIDRFNGGPFRPWIMKIATNHCLDLLRQNKRHAALPLESHYDNGDEIEDPSWLVSPDLPIERQVELSELQDRVQHHINRLPPKYRTAVILVDIQQMDYLEAASIMGIHIGTFKSRLSRARAQLQKWIQIDKKNFSL